MGGSSALMHMLSVQAFPVSISSLGRVSEHVAGDPKGLRLRLRLRLCGAAANQGRKGPLSWNSGLTLWKGAS